MSQKLKIFFSIIFFLTLTIASNVFANDDQNKLQELEQKIQEYNAKITELQAQGATLSNQIQQFNAQIGVAQLNIDKTQEQISLLGGRIDQLSASLEDLFSAFQSRVVETYKMVRLGESAIVLVSAPNVNKAISRYHYLQKIQQADRDLLKRLQNAQDTYKVQKSDFEELEKELENEKQELDNQKSAKAHLLSITNQDEAKYQELLSAARAEYEAIQAILAGRGEEEEVGPISQGSRIASVIQGPSCNSSAAHLHFIVSDNGNTQNPFSHLKSIGHENCSGPGVCSPGDPFNPSGGWDWPISPTIRFTQGYGYTWAVQNTWVGRIYQFHNGIDINSESAPTVKAVKSGTLFQGSYAGSGGCRLRYVRVDHQDSNLDTFYLHINY